MKSKSFNTWINELGTGEVARLLNVEPATVRHWRQRFHCYPRVDQMKLIKKLTKGQITDEFSR